MLFLPVAWAQTATNTATVTPPVGLTDPVCNVALPACNSATDSDPVVLSADLAITKDDGVTNVRPGTSTTYIVTVTNNGPTSVAGAIITDTAPAGLTITAWTCAVTTAGTGSVTSACGAASGTGNIATTADLANGGVITYTVNATVNVGASGSIVNTATVAPPAGVTDPVPGNNSGTDTNTVDPVPVVDFCPSPSAVFNIGQFPGSPQTGRIYRYGVGGSEVLLPELTLNVPSDLNGLMIDPVRNRLLFVSQRAGQATLYAYDAANGGWYVAAGPVSAPTNLVRGGMNQSGVGYLMTSGNSPHVWRVESNGTFSYSLTDIGQLTFDVVPTNSNSGDIAFDGHGQGWIATGADIYRVDFTASPLVAVRQIQPLLNGAPSSIVWASAAFGDDGRLYLTNNGTGGRYYALNLATGELTPQAATVEQQSRDTASCAHPTPLTDAQLQVEKVLAQVNGAPYVAGNPVAAGDTLAYAITVTHAGGTVAATLYPGEVIETLPANTTPVAAGNDFTCTGSSCPNTAAVNVPVGGSTVLDFIVQVNDPVPAGVTEIANAVSVHGVDCAVSPNDCAEATPVVELADVSLTKVLDTAGPYLVGQTVSFTITVSNAGPSAATNVQVTDTMTNLSNPTFSGACTAMPCTIASIASGATATITATGTITAEGAFANAAAIGGLDQTDPDNSDWTDEDGGVAVQPIEAIDNDYTPTPIDGESGGSTGSVLDNDTLGNQPVDPGQIVLTPGTSPHPGLVMNPDGTITVAPGTPPGTYQYPYTICEIANPGNWDTAIATVLVEGLPTSIRITKSTTTHDVVVGDLVRYTLVMENTGAVPVTDATLVDTPPAGFTYVAESLVVADADNSGRLIGTYPIRVDRIDIPVGGRASITYLLRVGAGVRGGVLVNTAYTLDNGVTASNVATAQVVMRADPLLEESLVLGTVFDDRDGDGWQDPADLGGVRVQGGFAPAAYVAGSTVIDRGDGPQPVADASAPLLHGIDIGAMAARQSDADPLSAHTIVIRQTLSEPRFTDDFVLSSDQGLTVRMDAAGVTHVERSGQAAKGLTGAEVRVERHVAAVQGGYAVEYRITNAGVDERGIPGVRVASVEGLLMETDQYGRYHLVGMDGGPWERGRNMILKVDAATLPAGSVFTTDNPLLRRVTPGLPVRFDFGVRLPPALIDAPAEQQEMLLGSVLFAPGSAELQPQYASVIERIAEQVRAQGSGRMVIAANGEAEALAYDRARTVRDAVLGRLTPAHAESVSVELRTDLDDPDARLAVVGETTLLGTVLFDTDSARIRPEFAGLLAGIAADIDAMGGGVVSVVGHADARGSTAYNDALGMRRARAVQEAIAARLAPQTRSQLRVQIHPDPTTPVQSGNTPKGR